MIGIIVGILCCLLVLIACNRLRTNKKCAYVVILGDIGRSPRMQFHSVSLARAGFVVYIFGYGGSEPYPEVVSNPSIRTINIAPFPGTLQKLPRFVVFVLKVVWQCVTLLMCLVIYHRPSHVLLQNPPSLPTIAVCWLASRIHASRLIIDWHNYGYTILALELRKSHPLVVIHKWYEQLFGRFADHNICVTNAMREDLMCKWNVRPVVTMHDRPAAIFTDLSIEDQHKFYCKLDIFRANDTEAQSCVELSSQTIKDGHGKVAYRKDRPAIVVSGTSWTEDEDFSILLHALDIYDEHSSADDTLPRLVCVITGKGPLKEHYRKLVDSRDWSRVKLHMPWLEAADYPRMLASADLGVCLHKSSSGLDLPMKVVDMFGCRLPVCAVHFHSLKELVLHDQNGLVFNTQSELVGQLENLLRYFPERCDKLQRYRDNLKSFQQLRWENSWTQNVFPLFS